MNAGKYGRTSGVLKELLTLDPNNQEARRLFATLQLRIGSLVTARTAFESMVQEAMERQDYWLAESLLREYLAAGPRCVPFLDLLGQVFEIKGDPDAAVKEYAKAVEILIEDPDPEHPNQAAILLDKILSIDPHCPAAFRLESLLSRQKEASEPPTGSASEPGLSPWSETPMLTSHEESFAPEIPPADLVESARSSVGPARLPWEDEGHDVELSSAQTQSTETGVTLSETVETGAAERSAAGAECETGPRPESSSPAVDVHTPVAASTENSPAEESPPSFDVVAPHPVGAVGPVFPEGPPFPVSESPSTPEAETAGIAPRPINPVSVAESPAFARLPTPVDLDEILARLSAPTVTESSVAPVATEESAITIPDTAHRIDDQESPSPCVTIPPVDTAAPAESTRRTIAAPMPWEQVEEGSIVVPPPASDAPTESVAVEPAEAPAKGSSPEEDGGDLISPAGPPAETLPLLMPRTSPDGHEAMAEIAISEPPPESSERSAIAAPMPWEQVEERPLVVPPVVAEEPEPSVEAVAQVEVTATSMESPPIPPSIPPEQAEAPPVEVPAVFLVEASTADPVSNDQLIATILEQTDLREAPPAPVVAQANPPAIRVADMPASAPPLQVGQEPASIRALLDSAIIRVLPPSVASVEDTQPGAPEPLADVVEPEIIKTQAGAAEVPPSASEAPVAEAAVAELSLPPVPEPQPSMVEPVSEVAPKEKSRFSIFPAVLRLVGVGKEPSTELDIPAVVSEETGPVAEARPEPVMTMDPVAEEVATIAPESPTDGQADVPEAVQEEMAAPEPPAPLAAPAIPPAPEPAMEVIETPVSMRNEQTGPEVTIATARPETDDAVDSHREVLQSSAEAAPKKKRERRRKNKAGASTETAPRSSPEATPTPVPCEEPMAQSSVVAEVDLRHEDAAPAQVSPSPAPPTPEPVAVLSAEPVAPSRAVPIRLVEPMVVPELSRPSPASKPKPVLKLGGGVRRLWWQLTSFVQTCFATAHALTVTAISLAALTIGLAVLGIGGLGVVWLGMEEKPSKPYLDLISAQPHSSADVKRSGYALFLGLGAPDVKDPVQAGAELYASGDSQADLEACASAAQSSSDKSSSVASTLGSWFREPHPSSTFGAKASTLKDWTSEAATGIGRYRQWAGLPFEDAGYGQVSGPNCARVLFVHRLHVAEGFTQSLDQGIDRVEADLTHWRSVLRKARTLGVKMLAVAAVNDDLRVISGLIASPEFDAKHLQRLTKATVPLDQAEISMRWPMQSQFVVQKKLIDEALKSERTHDRPWYVTGIAAMPVPRQRLLNDYAEYYEALIKTAETSREKFVAPNLYARIHAPAQGTLDYLSNPISNVVGVETGPAWETHVGQVRETDALLRLVSLQAWLRKTAPEGMGDVKARVAKAGQNFYDPFTGFPMLINLSRGRLYSVGMNGKDDDASPDLDVSVGIPQVGSGASPGPAFSLPKK